MFEVVGLIEVYLLDKLGSHSLVASHAPRAMGQQQFAAEDINATGMNQCKGNCLWMNYRRNCGQIHQYKL